ncbi:TPA: phage major capsid protein [Streptococcus pyogenes]|nr:phage major capsid protein [Streptococcus pyogenes]
MAINLKELPKYREAVAERSAKISAGATPEEQEKLFEAAFTTMGDEILAKNEEEMERMFDLRDKNRELTAEEIKFFNDIDKNVGGKDKFKLLPEETMVQVFDDLVAEHPLLKVINFKNTSLRLKALTAETSGTAVWGDIFGEIKGQLKQAFKEQDFSQFKLTAFVVIPKDALKFGPKWIKQFITEQLKEAIAVALELAIVKGNGLLQPVGLVKDLSQPTVDQSTGRDITTYKEDKKAIADLSDLDPDTAVELLVPVMKHLSVNDKKHPLKIAGQVKLLLNPEDRWTLEAKFTSRNQFGEYVTVLPHGITILESLAVDAGKAIAFVANRYDAFMATASTIEEYDQTFAMEDLQLYLTKNYFYGKAKDNHTAALLTLAGG